MVSKNKNEVIRMMKELNQGTMKFIQEMMKENPEKMKAFHELMESIEAEGGLSQKTKELISVALAVVKQCKYCIAFHVENALKAGATKQEIMESAWVAVLMGGGPALMYMQLVEQAIKEFSQQ